VGEGWVAAYDPIADIPGIKFNSHDLPFDWTEHMDR
jgi:hypothetical protein